MSSSPELEEFMNGLIRRNPGEPEFHQAVHEVAQHIIPFVAKIRSTRLLKFCSD